MLKEYVKVPSAVFQNFEKMKEYFEISFNYVKNLKQKNKAMNNTQENPTPLKTPPLTSEYTMHKDVKDGKEILVCTVGKTVLHYDHRCLAELHAMLKKHGDWMELGSTDEQKPAKEGTVEAWGRSPENPVGGWYGLKKGLRGRFGMYIPPLMEALGLAEVEHNPKNNKMRAK